MDDRDYRFLSALAEEDHEDVSSKVRELVDLGRVMLAIEKYRRSEASDRKGSKDCRCLNL